MSMIQSEERMYNVIWADDDIMQIATDRDIEDWRRDDHINIIARAQTGNELRSAMKEKLDMVDAVIVDANFDENEFKVESEKVISGLRRAFDLNEKYNEEEMRGIPFFLYTGRNRVTLEEACEPADKKKLHDIFETTGRWFVKGSKGVYDKLFEKIKEDVDKNNSLEFMLRRQFSKEFNDAELIKGGQKWLMEALKFEFEITGEYRSTKDYFNPARMIWEQINEGCVQNKFLPPLTSLNGVISYFNGKEEDNYTQLVSIMPKTLVHSLEYFLSITQDGSHNKSDLILGVIQYVNDKKNVNLYRTIIYIAMDLLLWYKELLDNPPQGPLWKTEYLDEGIIKEYNNGRYIQYYIVSKKIYELKVDKGSALPVGKKVGILGSTPTKYPFSTPEGVVEQVAFKSQYVLL